MILTSTKIKKLANNQGFALCGIAKAKSLETKKAHFEEAVRNNYHAKKLYLERDIDKRFQPDLLLPNCKSVIVCGFNYFTKIEEKNTNSKISKYAQIEDYHVFMKDKMKTMVCLLQKEFGTFSYKTTIDSSAISEKAWAVEAGIGYYGKNGIIQTKLGSFVFLGAILIDCEVDNYDSRNEKNCGDCCKCITTCPTNAIVSPYIVDCNMCISHINLGKKIDDFTEIAKYGWLIACDECQNVCPNNKYAIENPEAVMMQARFVENQYENLLQLTPESFEKLFKNTVIYSYGFEGLRKRVEDFNIH